MAPTDAVDDRNRIARIALAGVAALVALQSLRRGKRARGVLAALGAVALGYSAREDAGSTAPATEEDTRTSPSVDDGGTEVSIETTPEAGAKLRCAACGEPIVPGQRRGPDAHDRTVHEACLPAAA